MLASFRELWILASSMSLVPVLWDLTQDLNQVNCYRMAEPWTRDGKPECATDTSSDLERTTSPFWTSTSLSLK